MDSLISDFIYAFRVFFKRPGLTILAIIALSVSLGMSTAAFSSLNGMFFKPLPFKDPQDLHTIHLENKAADMDFLPIPHEHYKDLENMASYSETVAYYSGTINVSGKGHPKRYDGGFVTPGFLHVLGYSPFMGKSFSIAPENEEVGELIISHKVWQDQFRGDPDVVGTRIRANGSEHSIIGVLQEGFHFPNNVDVWLPIREESFKGPRPHIKQMQVYALGRIAPGATLKSTQEELGQVFSQWNNVTIEDKESLELTCRPFGRFRMNQASSSLLVAAIGAVIFVLLVSCANVANLLVGRAMSRGREMAIRSAVGATRGRIVRQLLTESLLLSCFGAIGGLLYAAWAVDATMTSPIYKLPYWMDFELDWRVFSFAFAVMVLTALVSGLVPAWQASKIDLNEMLKDTSHTSTSFRMGRFTRLLAIVQIAFSCALLFGAGLITRNVYKMANIEPGYAGEEILTMRMGLFPADYPTESDKDAFYEELTEKVSKIPGIESAAVTSWIAQFGNYKQPFLIEQKDSNQPQLVYAYRESISPEYFSAMDMQLLEGRNFNEDDKEDSQPVAIVNEAFAKMFMKGKEPVGETLNHLFDPGKGETSKPMPLLVVGIAPAIRVSNFLKPEDTEPIVYFASTQSESAFMSLICRMDNADRAELEEAIQNVILSLDPNLPVYFTKTMAEYLDDQIYPYRLLANFFLAIGLMALFLAAIGVYGMLAFNVSRRRREIGIRMALGADTFGIVSQVLRQGFIQLMIGLLVGTGLAYLVGQLTRDFLFGINPLDPSVYMGVLLTLIGVATLAFFIPARRAANLSPMDALRYE